MNSEEQRLTGKIHYEKPTAVDLGPAAPVAGASCGEGQVFIDNVQTTCQDTSNSASACGDGNSASNGNCSSGAGVSPP